MAAGLGFKTFTTGEVLSAADVNGYLMQGINVFADATARDAAITSPQEGQFAYTKDNNSLWYYSGSAWVASGAAGDITGVSVTSPITGGGTSGDVTIGISSSAVVPSQTGNSGKYLTTDGTTSSWGTISAGGYTQLASGSLTGSSVSLTSISQAYKKLVLVMNNVSITGNDQIVFRVNNYSTSDYVYSGTQNSTAGQGSGFSVVKLTWSNVDNTSANANFVIELEDYTQTTGYPTGTYHGTYIATSSIINAVNAAFGYVGAAAAISSIQLIANYGGSFTFDSGTYTLYGVK